MRIVKLLAVVAAVFALVYLAFAPRAHAATAHGDNTTVTTKDGDGIVIINGTKYRVVRGTSGGAMLVSLEDPDRETVYRATNIYVDTLSYAGARTRDSLAVPIDVHNFKTVTYLVKLEGAYGVAAAAVWRVGFTPRWHYNALVSDSTNTILAPELSQTSNNPYAPPDSIGSITDATVHTVYPGEVQLTWLFPTLTTTNGRELWKLVTLKVPAGAIGSGFLLRTISAPNGFAIKIRVSVVAGAL